jgi:DNA-directed RNA polymerase subunit RPC12/RpoP
VEAAILLGPPPPEKPGIPVPRAFDWQLAWELFATGDWTLKELGEQFGVCSTAVGRAVLADQRERLDATSIAYQRSGICRDCEGPCTNRPAADGGPPRCMGCAARAAATSVRDDGMLRCGSCAAAGRDPWHPPEAFPFGRSDGRQRRGHKNIARGGRAQQCTRCQTEAKRDWRRRNLLVCKYCGERRVVPDRGRAKRVKIPPICRDCWPGSPEARAAGRRAAETTKARREAA